MSKDTSRVVRSLPRVVILLGLVSLFNDAASEMVVPLIPVWLLALGQGPVALGLIEGVADAVASLLKLWSGRLSDRLAHRKGLAVAGYALSNILRPLIGLATQWGVVLGLRTGDRVGKGLRTAPRDAMLADAAPPEISAYAYGFHRAMDNTGAVLGALAAAVIISGTRAPVSEVLMVSVLPGSVAVLLIAFAVREAPAVRVRPEKAPPPRPWSELPPGLRRYLTVLALFAIARASEVFLVLLARTEGVSIVASLVLWAVFNGAKALTAGAGGRLADRRGNRRVLLISWSAHAVGFLLLGVAQGVFLWIAVIFYGLCAGFGEGAERARVRDLASDQERGAAFGWYHLVIGLAAIPGGLLFGGVWHFATARAAFWLSAALMVTAAALLNTGPSDAHG
ncbi:MAG: MFS transporter [Acidiferrobacteraceae bacterium]